MSSAICFNLDRSKILSSGNGLNLKSGSLVEMIKWDLQERHERLRFLCMDAIFPGIYQ